MAISALQIKAKPSGTVPVSGFWQDGTTGALLAKTFGAASVPSLPISLTFGTGSGAANWAYYASRALAGTTADNLDLSGSLTDGLGNTITATKLKLAVISISSPDGTKNLRVGPRGVANAMLAGFGDASDYSSVTHWWVYYEPVTGATVTAGTGDMFCIYNPTGSSITYSIMMAGV